MLCFSYSVAHERDTGVEKWSSDDDIYSIIFNSYNSLCLQVGELCFSYSVAHERDTGVEKWSSDDDMEPFRTVIVFPADKLQVVVDKIKDELAASGT